MRDPVNAEHRDCASQPVDRFTMVCSVLFLIGIWMLARPYSGVRHDGILYVGQALLHLYPDIYSRDVFFAHGSQDSYSIFAPIYAWLIDHNGLPTSAMLLEILGQTAFLSSLALLARQFLKGWDLWLGLVFVAIMPGFYGGLGIFSYAENFVTARTFAEPLSLLGLYSLWRRWWMRGGLLLTLAVVMHPLVAIPALALAWVQIASKQPRAWWLALGLLAAPVLALLNVPPFDLLLRKFDPDWLATVENNSKHLFLRLWKLEDWSALAYDLFALLLVQRYARGALRGVIESLLTVGLGAIILTALFADLLDSVFITSLQIWRVLWVAHLAAILLTPWLYLRIYEGESRQNALVIIALLYLALVGSRYPGALMALALAGLLIWRGRQLVISNGVKWFVLAAVLAAIGSVTFKDLKANSYLAGKADSFNDVLNLTVQGLTRPACLTLIAVAFLYSLRTRKLTAAVLISGAALSLGVYSYDQRSAWAAFVENGLTLSHPFEEKLPPHAQVYWQGDMYGLLGTWLLLKHPSYLTQAQGAGVTFDRETARHFGKREEAFAPLIFQETICAIMNSLDDRHCAVDIQALRDVCLFSDPPDFMIIESHLPGLAENEWSFETNGFKLNTFFLYRCDRIR